MIVLQDRHAPVGNLLLPQARVEWIASSQRPSFEPLEHGTLTRWRVTARLHDGHVAWRGWFDDREDADAFLYAMASGSLPYERELWSLPSPEWHPDIAPPEAVYAVATLTFITATGAGTYTVPADFNSSNNTIETIGGGASATGSGGGAAYSQIANLALTPGASINRTVAAVGGDSFFNGASLAASSVGAKGTSTITGAATTSGIGTIKYAGGDGANGGGGAAGPNGAGNTAPGTGVGGSGDAGFGGAGGTAGAAGGNGGGGGTGQTGNPGAGGTEWDASHGSGGGGGQGGRGGDSSNGGTIGGAGGNGGAGGLYGAGGGVGGSGGSGSGAPAGGSGASGVGKQGIIVVTYTPATSAGFSISMLGM